MNVKKILIDAINELYAFPIILQGSMSVNDEYPSSFFTFWNNDTFNGNFYSNISIKTTWEFDVNFYSTDPALVDSVLENVIHKLINKGFKINGVGHDVISDESSHSGRGITIVFENKQVSKNV